MGAYSSSLDMEIACTPLAMYIIDEFKSYGVDFNFDEPIVVGKDGRVEHYVTIYLQGRSLPQDCYKSDEDVLYKFVLKTISNFLKIEGLENKLKVLYLSCTIGEITIMPFFVNIELTDKI